MFCHWLVEIKKYDFPSNEVSPVDEAIVFEYAVEEVQLQPEYLLNQCAEETGFDETELNRCIRAIHRKKQAILQGPPGTGKTFIAEKLAKHLISGGDGFWETDTISSQPILMKTLFRYPSAKSKWQLTYSIVPGRFLEFCTKAEPVKTLALSLLMKLIAQIYLKYLES